MKSKDNVSTAAGYKSWGVMLYEMIVGMTPFYDGTQDQVCVFFVLILKNINFLQFLSITTRADGAFQEHCEV